MKILIWLMWTQASPFEECFAELALDVLQNAGVQYPTQKKLLQHFIQISRPNESFCYVKNTMSWWSVALKPSWAVYIAVHHNKKACIVTLFATIGKYMFFLLPHVQNRKSKWSQWNNYRATLLACIGGWLTDRLHKCWRNTAVSEFCQLWFKTGWKFIVLVLWIF